MMQNLCKKLRVKYENIGKLTLATKHDELGILLKLKRQGEINGVTGLEILNSQQMQNMQPKINGIAALYSPTTSIVSPYDLTIALAENSYRNGVDFYLNYLVVSIIIDETFVIKNSLSKQIRSKIVINCAGIYAAHIASMVGISEYVIYPCRGEYYVLDKSLSPLLSILVYPAPKSHGSGLGIHFTKTVDGNILIGPSNEYLDRYDDYATTRTIMEKLQIAGKKFFPQFSLSKVIRNFSGLRAKQTSPTTGGFKDFIIEKRKDVPGFINLVGIESPGLTSAPAIAQLVRDFVDDMLVLKEKTNLISEPFHKNAQRIFELSDEERLREIYINPDYGEIICRCENITKGEIIEAINNPLKVKTLAAIKYRSRAMMGRCQGCFCIPRIIKILEQESSFQAKDLLYKSPDSYIFTNIT